MKTMQLATAVTVVATAVAGDGAAAAAASPPQPVLHRGLLKCLLLLVVFVSLALPTTASLSTTDMVLWLRADDVTCSADDDAVSSWADRSGQGNDASQSSAAYQPLCTQASSDLGGQSAVSFGSADSLAMMTCGSPVYANGSGITVFAVVADAAQASSATIPYVFDEGLIAGWRFGMTFSTSSLNGYTPTNAGGFYEDETAVSYDSGSHVLQMRVVFGQTQQFSVDTDIVLSSSITVATLDATTVGWNANAPQATGPDIDIEYGGPFTVGAQSKYYNQAG